MAGSDADTVDHPEDPLAAAVAEDPEAVAELVRRLDAVTELLDVLALGESALTDEMVVELAGTGATLAESADGLATDETVRLAASVGANGDELADAVETLVSLQRDGTLDELAELADVVSLLTAALDDEMVRTLAATGSGLGELADAAAEPDTREGVETMLDGVGAATREDPDPVGAVGLVRALRDPEVRQGLGYVLAAARAVGAARAEVDARTRGR